MSKPEYVVHYDPDVIEHHGVLGQKWGHRKQNVSTGKKHSGRKRTLRANMSAEQRHASNVQIGANIAGSIAGASVGSAVGKIVALKTGSIAAGSAINSAITNTASLGATAAAAKHEGQNKNIGRTVVMSAIFGPFGASTIYAKKK